MNEASDIIRHAALGGDVTYEEARRAAEHYPASVVADIAALSRQDLSPSQAEAVGTRVAMALGSNESLDKIFDGNLPEYDNFYPDSRSAKPATEQAIDDFIDKFSRKDPQKEADALEKMIFNPTPGSYAEFIEQNEQQKPDTADKNTHPAQPPVQDGQKQPELPAEGALTEGFARILIKNHNYAKALEIIEALNLNNPKKSIYFADQIRFLRKLIINANKQ